MSTEWQPEPGYWTVPAMPSPAVRSAEQAERIAAGEKRARGLAAEHRQAVAAAKAAQAAGDPYIMDETEPCEAPPSASPVPPTSAEEILAALREFDTWLATGPHYPDELDDPERGPAGMCCYCHLGAAVTSGRCFWCQLAVTEGENLRAAKGHAPDHVPCSCRGRRRRAIVSRVVFAVAFWAVLWLAALAVLGRIRTGG